jgi:hypothetical protein
MVDEQSVLVFGRRRRGWGGRRGQAWGGPHACLNLRESGKGQMLAAMTSDSANQGPPPYGDPFIALWTLQAL